MSQRSRSPQKLRMEIAAEAAKIVAQDGAADYHSAKRKAAAQLGLSSNRNLPTNREIETALIDYQNLFQSDAQAEQLQALRRQAIRAMKLLEKFNPRLVGPVSTGTATGSTEITLHLFHDNVERVGLFLTEQGIPNQSCEKHVRINATEIVVFPAYRFMADDDSFLLVVFSAKDRNLNPVSSIDNKPMSLLNLEQVTKLADE